MNFFLTNHEYIFQNDIEAAREAYDAFLSHYPYCYGYWRKYADYEKRKGNKKKCEEVCFDYNILFLINKSIISFTNILLLQSFILGFRIFVTFSFSK